MNEWIAIIDFGSQYSALIARRLRELGVYSELFPHTTTHHDLKRDHLKGIILSGGPRSIYEPGAPRVDASLLEAGVPVLGICYGMQSLANMLGGRVEMAAAREYGHARVKVPTENPLVAAGYPAGVDVAWRPGCRTAPRLPSSWGKCHVPHRRHGG